MKKKIFSILFALVLIVSFSLVTAVPAAANTDRLVPGTYATIQLAINAADPGDTIIVSDGIYIEDLVVNTPNLTLKSVNGRDFTTIKGVTGHIITLNAGGGGFTLGGAALTGFTVDGNDTDSTQLLQTAGGPSDVTISYNAFDISGAPSMAIAVGAAGGNDLDISYNTFVQDGIDVEGSTDCAIWLDGSVNDLVIDNNTFTASSESELFVWNCNEWVKFIASSSTTGATITNNTVTNAFMKIDLQGRTAILDNITFQYNTLHNSLIDVRGASGAANTVKNFTIKENEFSRDVETGTFYGLYINEGSSTDKVDTSTWTIEQNMFSSTIKKYAIGTYGGINIIAQKNWWNGDADGPWYSGNTGQSPGGSGYATVKADNGAVIHYSPWCVSDDNDAGTVGYQYPTPMTWGASTNGTIQEAIGIASAGDTIIVVAGTYDVSAEITVNKQLTLNGANVGVNAVTGTRGAESIIDATGLAANFTMTVSAAGVTIDGFTMLADDTGHGQITALHPFGINTGCVVKNNIIDGFFDGVSQSATDWVISQNTIKNSRGCGIRLQGGSGVEISDNLIKDGDNAGIIFYDSDITITNNTLTNNAPGVMIVALTALDSISITGNTISGSGTYGIRVWDDSVNGKAITNLVITKNEITSSATSGILIQNSHLDATDVINYNDISGNTSYGIENTTSTVVDAKYNWWGGAAGPQHAGNPYDTQATTQGNNAVSYYVDYSPWLIHNELVADWNIWSTPIALSDNCDTVDDALDLWGVDSTKKLIACYFDSSASPQAWSSDITSLTPLQAYYLKMSGAGTIDVCFSTDATFPPSRTMYQGWNLVGPAQLYNMAVDAALLDAFHGTGVAADLWGYSKAISPAVNQTYWTYLRAGVNTDKNFIPTNGYWVYMVNQGNLGGFTSTPITIDTTP